MRTIALCGALALVSACAGEPRDPVSPAADALPARTLEPAVIDGAVAERVLVRFRPDAPILQILGVNNARRARELGFGIEMLQVAPGRERDVAAALARSPWVEFAEPDWVRKLEVACGTPSGSCAVPSDPYFGYKW